MDNGGRYVIPYSMSSRDVNNQFSPLTSLFILIYLYFLSDVSRKITLQSWLMRGEAYRFDVNRKRSVTTFSKLFINDL